MPIVSRDLRVIQKSGPRAGQNNPHIFAGDGNSSLFNTGSTSDNLSLYSSWSWSCINLIASELSGLEWEVSIFDKLKGDRVPAKEHHWLVDLISDPNPDIEPSAIWDLATRWFLINGNAYLYMPTYGEKVPQEVWVLPSNRVTVIRGQQGEPLIKGYSYAWEGGDYVIPAEEVVHWKFLDPSSDPLTSLFVGRSPISAARDAIEVDLQNQRFQAMHYRNGAVPAFVVKDPEYMDPDSFKQFKAQWDQTFKGVGNAGKWALLDGNKGIEVLGGSNQIKDATALDVSNRARVCAAWNIPEDLLLGKYGAKATSETMKENLHRGNIMPKAQRLAEGLTRMARRYDTETDPTMIFLPYTYNDPAEVRAERKSWFEMGVDVNTLRIEEGFEPIAEKDKVNPILSTASGITNLLDLVTSYGEGSVTRQQAIEILTQFFDRTVEQAEAIFPLTDTTAPQIDDEEDTDGDVPTLELPPVEPSEGDE